MKKLRKASSLFVRDELYTQLVKTVEKSLLKELCQIKPLPDGVGDDTYPEPCCSLPSHNWIHRYRT